MGDLTKLREKLLKQERLFDENIGLVFKVISQFPLRDSYEFDDLFQVGCYGLWKAVKKNDENKGFKFSSLAFPCIKGELINYSKIISHRRIGEEEDDILERLVDYRDNNDLHHYDEYYPLYDAICQLRRVPRSMVIEYYWNDKDTIKLGEVYNKNSHAIWMIITRALKKLKQIMSQR